MSKYNKGDRVVLRKDLVVGEDYGGVRWYDRKDEDLGELGYVEILNVFGDEGYIVTNGRLISDEMIKGLYVVSSVEVDTVSYDDTTYLWMTDEFDFCGDGCVLIIGENNRAHTYVVDSVAYEEILEGEYSSRLLTESEAKKHPLFKATKQIDVRGDMYYIRIKGYSDKYLSKFNNGSGFMMGSHILASNCKTQFTEEECNELIGNSPVLYKELVK